MSFALLAAVIPLDGRPRYIHHGWFLISYANLVVIVAMIVGAFAVRRFPAEVRRKVIAAIVVPAVTIYVAISIQPLDRGLRYAFPLVALSFVIAGAAATVEPVRWRRVGLGALAVTLSVLAFAWRATRPAR